MLNASGGGSVDLGTPSAAFTLNLTRGAMQFDAVGGQSVNFGSSSFSTTALKPVSNAGHGEAEEFVVDTADDDVDANLLVTAP